MIFSVKTMPIYLPLDLIEAMSCFAEILTIPHGLFRNGVRGGVPDDPTLTIEFREGHRTHSILRRQL